MNSANRLRRSTRRASHSTRAASRPSLTARPLAKRPEANALSDGYTPSITDSRTKGCRVYIAELGDSRFHSAFVICRIGFYSSILHGTRDRLLLQVPDADPGSGIRQGESLSA